MMWEAVACGFLCVALLIALVGNWFLWREAVRDEKLINDLDLELSRCKAKNLALTHELEEARKNDQRDEKGRYTSWQKAGAKAASVFDESSRNDPEHLG